MESNPKKSHKNREQGKPSLLLHACCAPCSTSVYFNLAKHYDLTVYWYNPNIFPQIEHDKRLNELIRLSRILNFKIVIEKSSSIDHSAWRQAIKGHENEPEGGSRCSLCFRFRLQKAALYAAKNSFAYFSTTLTVSPHKDSPTIIAIGNEIGLNNNMAFLKRDFKRNNGYQLSCQHSRKYNLYRQNYCGCEFSAK